MSGPSWWWFCLQSFIVFYQWSSLTADVWSVGLKVGHEQVTSIPTNMAAKISPMSSVEKRANQCKRTQWRKAKAKEGHEQVKSILTNMASRLLPMSPTFHQVLQHITVTIIITIVKWVLSIKVLSMNLCTLGKVFSTFSCEYHSR